MSTENQATNENELEVESIETVATEPVAPTEVTPTMDDFKDQIEHSFKKINQGDILKGTVIGISETEVSLDLSYYTEGIIKLEELSNDPSFSIKADTTLGEEISAIVLREDDGHGNILLSKKRADDVLAWDHLIDALENKKIVNVKISQAVKGGVLSYLHGVRAFIPASQLSMTYVEDLETWVGNEVEAIVITASAEDKRLVLSSKEVERENFQKNMEHKISQLQQGIVTTGKVEKIVPYGAFVNIGDGLSGLVHISQICWKRIKSPNEIIKEGDEVTVKVIEIKDGKISLSMKAIEDKENVIEDVVGAPSTYSTGEEATTGLASLLKNIKL